MWPPYIVVASNAKMKRSSDLLTREREMKRVRSEEVRIGIIY